MYSYGWLSVTALICYLLLLIALLSAKRDRLINSFIYILTFMILWTAGSYFMRLMMWPSMRFWFHASLLGLMFFPLAFLNFITEFLNIKGRCGEKGWLVVLSVCFIINAKTEFFLAPPKMVEAADGFGTAFVYEFSWPVVLLFLIFGIIVVETLMIVFK